MLADEAPGEYVEQRRIWRALERLAEVRLQRNDEAGARAAAERFRAMVEGTEPDDVNRAEHEFDRFRAVWLSCRAGDEELEPLANELANRLLEAEPDRPEYLLAVIRMLIFRPLGIESPQFQRAQKLCDHLLELEPDNTAGLAARCVLDDHAGNVLVRDGRLEEARAVRQGLVDRSTKFLQSHVDALQLNNLAVSLGKLADVERLLGRDAEATRHATEAVNRARELVALEPATIRNRNTLASSLITLADVVGENDRSREFDLRKEALDHVLAHRSNEVLVAVGGGDLPRGRGGRLCGAAGRRGRGPRSDRS